VLGPKDAEFFAHHYDVTEGGNFEGHNILNRLAGLERSPEDEARLTALREKLLTVRGKRIRPGLDDKVLADWNGLMIASLVNASLMLREPSWIDLAARAFDFIARAMIKDGRLGHSWRDSRLLFPGLVSDYAAMIRAALTLYEATGQGAYLERALAWQRDLDAHYANAQTGGYYLTADDAAGLIVRPASTLDDATPNPNSIAAQNLVRLAVLAGDESWRTRADNLIEGVLASAGENPFAHIALLNALDLRLRGAEIVVTGQGAESDALLAAARALPYTERIVLAAPAADALPASHPAREKIASAPQGAAFVCIGERCSLPVTQPEKIAEAMAGMRRQS